MSTDVLGNNHAPAGTVEGGRFTSKPQKVASNDLDEPATLNSLPTPPMFKNGQLHDPRFDIPATDPLQDVLSGPDGTIWIDDETGETINLTTDPKTGGRIMTHHDVEGRLHNLEGPALTVYTQQGGLARREYRKHGEWWRPDGLPEEEKWGGSDGVEATQLIWHTPQPQSVPTMVTEIRSEKSSSVFTVQDWRDPETGEYVRREDDSPNNIYHNQDGRYTESWIDRAGTPYVRDNDAPNYVEYVTVASEDGGERKAKVSEKWLAPDGSLNRGDGLPARICYNPETGKVTETVYAVNGDRYTPENPATVPDLDPDAGPF
ncbi:hypothetical protein [uncultured Mobiluncus sp.]|uniref:hypothetical protein n=1 Tax=uncultured Mobiluncus sp. TaxID=293425 RepID=UPI00261AF949|nr:hypothetical protein [uncultured Mobiluncus sp.]